ncbi:ribonuclease H1 small subunit [Acrodontium crateriforme]|uniref:Ribonuclease H1 small subunit n=1 Tax=Acrodontium crateriforme TaxID=150365 RepID=A0AAQ3MDX3_9PEZI|nr:ribonuclease H1 small subunit [Acrodontium crateriforme]
MLAINTPTKTPRKLTPNLLPCAIQHNGPIAISERYWKPQQVHDRNTSAQDGPAIKELPDSKDENAVNSSENSSSLAETSNDAATTTVYFRGRKLYGRALPIAPTYQGLILERTEDVLPQMAKSAVQTPVFNPVDNQDSDGEDDPFRRTAAAEEDTTHDKMIDVKQLNVQGTFDEVMVWGHEAIADEDDAFVRGVTEWMGFAQAMHAV